MQGQALSYNNFFWQASLISSPLILSAIYIYNKKWIYYFSSFTALIAIAVIGYVCTWDNVSVIGKKSMYEVGEEEKKESAVEVEMKTVSESNDVPAGETSKVEVKNENTSLFCVS